MKKNIRNRLAAVLLVLCSFFMCIPGGVTYGASSYEDAKLFFDSTGQTSGQHIEAYDGKVYFATKGGKASSSTMLLVQTIGHDVTLTGNGKSITFSTKRGGSLQEIEKARRDVDGYIYNLYQIETQRLIDLAKATGYPEVGTILSAPVITVSMNAIMTSKQNGKLHGSVEENGSGGLIESGKVYHLRDSAQLAKIKQTFTGFDFRPFMNIRTELANFQLSIMYSIGEKVNMNPAYTAKSFTAGSRTYQNILHNANGVVQEKYKLLQEFYLKNTGVADLNLSKEGYHLEAGKEWQTEKGVPFSVSQMYDPKEILPEVGTGSAGVVLFANWQPNTYTIIYNALGGKGVVSPTSIEYNETKRLEDNTYTKTGYYLPKGEEWVDANGKTYANKEEVRNLTSEHNKTITLYANWQPLVVMIDLDKQGGTGGTDTFWQKYGIGFYEDAGCSEGTTSILVPSREGYTFRGYYSYVNGGLPLLVEEGGQIHVLNTHFTKDKIAYANWEANKYTITFDKHGGIYGTDSATATYDKVFPRADVPVRNGYNFQGYFTEENGNGDRIYNENMSSDLIFRYTKDITLHAHWTDEIAPEITLNVSHNTWTNQQVILTAEAWDFGSGLTSIILYQVDEKGKETEVARIGKLNSVRTAELTFVNPDEGIIRYKAVATDAKGNTSESYNVVYYDVTAPSGTILLKETEDGRFYFEIDITDINRGD